MSANSLPILDRPFLFTCVGWWESHGKWRMSRSDVGWPLSDDQLMTDWEYYHQLLITCLSSAWQSLANGCLLSFRLEIFANNDKKCPASYNVELIAIWCLFNVHYQHNDEMENVWSLSKRWWFAHGESHPKLCDSGMRSFKTRSCSSNHICWHCSNHLKNVSPAQFNNGD